MGIDKIYLDYAAATPVDNQVFIAMKPYFSDKFYNPSANYSESLEVAKQIDFIRAKVANILSVKSEEIFFTAGGTEANNLAIKGIMELNPGKNIIISAIEHESVVDSAKKFDYRVAPVDKTGRVIISELEKLIDENTVLISIMYANNEIGTIQPMTKIKQLVTKIKQARQQTDDKLPLYFHTDACQAANYLSLNASGIGVDLMTLNGGKIYGPKQSGVLFVHRSVKLNPQILGGGQERGYRSGTENVPAIIGFGTALMIADKLKAIESKKLESLRDYFAKTLTSSITGCIINGSLKNRLANNLNVSFDNQDNELMLFKLDQNGIMCSTGSACSAQKDTISPTLLAIGLTSDQALSSLRFSLGRKTTKKQIDQTVKIIQKILS
ncbi:MAG TPA: cysteine desulfurase family protein [Candidatus Saccharimonadales bacterium]|jgi:cysteine desulfurase|nr:cysteine desulfurase family protein [Candidatus Saccharimonadales bacterium]